jgi:glycosyltransferase involved in cell wall biosynthesis
MKKIIFVADFFVQDIVGGGELNNEELISRLVKSKYEVVKVHSHIFTVELVEKHKNDFFIIANFVGLTEKVKESLLDKKYVIYEHDHKYLNTRNPSSFVNFLSPEENIVNKEFYKKSMAVFCQSKIHCDVVWRNLQIKNIINCSGNLWSKEHLQIIKSNMNKKKKYDYAILDSKNSIKNTKESIEYCEKNNLSYKLIPFSNFHRYIKDLSECSYFVFFPKTLETLSRTSIEAKLLGCKLITNKFLGVASEEWIKKEPEKIYEYINTNSDTIVQKFKDCIEENNIQKNFIQTKEMPKITIITSLFKSDKYIDNFLESIVKQTIFDECELLLINPNPTKKEKDSVKKYIEKYKNIRHIILDEDPGIYGCWNIGIKESSHDLLCNTNVDDLRNIDNLEILRKHLVLGVDIDLVYGDVSATSEQPTLNKKYSFRPYEHSLKPFSKENMIKCLPGPLPLWKKTMHNKCGMFDDKYQSAGDWEMWLRSVRMGSKFKKIDAVSGFYFVNPRGKSTSKEFEKKKFLEEKEIFFKYKDLFGKNYDLFLSWFSREVS